VQAERPNDNAAITHGAIRVIIAPLAVNRVEPTKDNGYIAPFLPMNPAVGLENLLAEPVRGDVSRRRPGPNADPDALGRDADLSSGWFKFPSLRHRDSGGSRLFPV
jgi:hypothetical protein